MRCRYCSALCRVADGRCHGCGEALRIGVAARIPELVQAVGLMAGAVALPVLLFDPKGVYDDGRVMKALLAAAGAVGGAIAGRVLGVFLAWATEPD